MFGYLDHLLYFPFFPIILLFRLNLSLVVFFILFRILDLFWLSAKSAEPLNYED